MERWKGRQLCELSCSDEEDDRNITSRCSTFFFLNAPPPSLRTFLLFVLMLTQSVQSLSRVQLFATPWTAARKGSLSITNSWSLIKLMSIELVMPSNHLILCSPLLLQPHSFPASGSFPVSQFSSGGQSIQSFSFSISPSNEYSGLISFSIDLFDLFSNTTVQKHQFFGAQLSL